jgi:hypothetical protein
MLGRENRSVLANLAKIRVTTGLFNERVNRLQLLGCEVPLDSIPKLLR